MSVGSRNETDGVPGTRPVLSNSHWVDFAWRLSKNKVAVAAFAVFLLICLACIFAPYITRWTYYEMNTNNIMQSPSSEHILGTDNLGRDMFSRILYGGRMTLQIAFSSAILALVIGGALGLVAGYFGRWLDFIISPLLDIIASIPVLLLVIVCEAVLGWGRGNFRYALALAAIPQIARLTRASVMNILGQEFIEAARALGVSHIGIISRHILHNIAPPLIIRFTSVLAEALLTCTIMGYLGIVVSPPTPEWGFIVFAARSHIRANPQLMIIPCAVIAICVLSISLFGDGLRDALDPRD